MYLYNFDFNLINFPASGLSPLTLNPWTLEPLNSWTLELLNLWTLEPLNSWTFEPLNSLPSLLSAKLIFYFIRSKFFLSFQEKSVTFPSCESPCFSTLSAKRQFSWQSEFFWRRESEEFGGEREVGFKFGNVANFVKGWMLGSWKTRRF